MKAATKLTLENTFYVSQRMLDSLQLLQMDRLTLEKHIAEQLLENPVLEFPSVYTGESPAAGEGHRGGSEYLLQSQTNAYETLAFFLTDQLERLQLSGKVLRLCKNLVRLMDENGYLPAQQVPEIYFRNPDYSQALAVLQSLEPAGVAAGDLKECLLLQLKREGEESSLATELVENHLEDISRRNYSRILRNTGISMTQLQDAIQLILTLNPRPGASFSSQRKTEYIHPDFVLTLQKDGIGILQEEQSFPTLRISEDYRRLYADTTDPEVKRYLKARVAAANHLIAGLEQRKSTSLRCLEAILQVQQGFFRNPSRQLAPLTLETVARMVGLHSSTVSRAVSGKYLEFEGRTYPLKYFFVRGLRDSGEGISTSQIRELIRQIVRNEDPAAPMSDQQIVQILEQGGCPVSRRTVAKYREQMGILSSKQRRKL